LSIKLGIIGGGVMGEALLSRLLGQGIYQPQTVLVSEPQPQRRETLAQRYQVQVTAQNQAVIGAEVLLLAVKPQIFEAVVADLTRDHQQVVQHQPLLISILAGVALKSLTAAFPHWPVVRAMPNTPATIGAGMTAIATGATVQPHHREQAMAIFTAVGQVVEVPETLMNAVTGLSGSGPGYVAVMVEALIDGGVAVGLPRTIATQLALQTLLGTAILLQENQCHPAVLKDQVTSPGGTTIAGIAQLERAGFRAALIEAVEAAAQRAVELG